MTGIAPYAGVWIAAIGCLLLAGRMLRVPRLLPSFLLISLPIGLRARGGSPEPVRRMCPWCEFDMRPLAAARIRTCPECGKTAKSERAMTVRRPRPRVAAALIALAALTPMLGVPAIDRAKRGEGWTAVVPSWALVLSFRWTRDMPEYSAANIQNQNLQQDDVTIAGQLRRALEDRTDRLGVIDVRLFGWWIVPIDSVDLADAVTTPDVWLRGMQMPFGLESVSIVADGAFEARLEVRSQYGRTLARRLTEGNWSAYFPMGTQDHWDAPAGTRHLLLDNRFRRAGPWLWITPTSESTGRADFTIELTSSWYTDTTSLTRTRRLDTTRTVRFVDESHPDALDEILPGDDSEELTAYVRDNLEVVTDTPQVFPIWRVYVRGRRSDTAITGEVVILKAGEEVLRRTLDHKRANMWSGGLHDPFEPEQDDIDFWTDHLQDGVLDITDMTVQVTGDHRAALWHFDRERCWTGSFEVPLGDVLYAHHDMITRIIGREDPGDGSESWRFPPRGTRGGAEAKQETETAVPAAAP